MSLEIVLQTVIAAVVIWSLKVSINNGERLVKLETQMQDLKDRN